MSKLGEKLYDLTAQFTGVSHFGTPLEDILGGVTAPPPQGARVDVAFAGTAAGERVRGEVEGIDYINVRADGRFELNIFGALTTPDGARIAFHAAGVATPQPDSPIALLREHVKLTTSHSDYAWVNTLECWGIGTVDPTTGTVEVTVYQA